MSIAFVGAGSGITIATGSNTISKSCTAGNFVICQLYYDGLVGDWGWGTFTNVLDFSGATGWQFLTSQAIGSAGGVAGMSIMFGRVASTGTVSTNFTVGGSGEDLIGRIYELSGVAAGTLTSDVLDFDEAGGSNGTSTAVAHASRTTHGADRFIVDLCGINAAQAVTSYAGEANGDLTLATTEYQGGGTIGTIALQTAAIPTATTVSGGAFTIASAAWGTWSTSLIPAAVAAEKQSFYVTRRRSWR